MPPALFGQYTDIAEKRRSEEAKVQVRQWESVGLSLETGKKATINNKDSE